MEELEQETWLHALNTDAGTRDVLVKLNMGQVVRGYSVDQSGILYYQAAGNEHRIVVPIS